MASTKGEERASLRPPSPFCLREPNSLRKPAGKNKEKEGERARVAEPLFRPFDRKRARGRRVVATPTLFSRPPTSPALLLPPKPSSLPAADFHLPKGFPLASEVMKEYSMIAHATVGDPTK